MRIAALAFVLVAALGAPAAAQSAFQVQERAIPDSLRVIAGSASTGAWAPAHDSSAGRNRAMVQRGIEQAALRLCQQQARGATDCQILTSYGPGPGCGTIARSAPATIVAGTGATPEAARAAALEACQTGGRRCTLSAQVYCYR